jgi:hypothetical protein
VLFPVETLGIRAASGEPGIMKTGHTVTLVALCATLSFLGRAATPAGPAEVAAALEAAGGEVTELRRFDAFTVWGETFTNVIVLSSSSASNIFLRHERGLAGFSVKNLDNPTLRRLGVEVASVPVEEPRMPTGELVAVAGIVNPSGLMTWVVVTLGGLVLLGGGFYVYTCYVLRLICVKAQAQPGIAIWLPFLQLMPLLRAAKMSRWWMVGLGVFSAGCGYAQVQWPGFALAFDAASALSGLALWGVWAVRICQARQKHLGVAFLLLLPGVNYLALLYLAASR